MSVTKKIRIDGMEVPFKASAAITRMYRDQFRRDIFQDLSELQKEFSEKSEADSKSAVFSVDSLEIFENIAYIMAKHADASVPDSPDEWLEQFQLFSIYRILPQLLELWGLNIATQVTAKKNNAQLTEP